jgi:2-haloacid dehalogenase
MPDRPTTIVFDVNETLLDVETLRPIVDRIFNGPAAMGLWFAHLISYPEALTLSGVYMPFTDIGGAVLRMLAAARGISMGDADGIELTHCFPSMPPHSGASAALRRLRGRGFRLFTLTDNTLEISGPQVTMQASSTCSNAASASMRPCTTASPPQGVRVAGERARARPPATSAEEPATSGTR